MFNFFGLNSILGVDIGTASIKIAEISKSSPKPKLKNYGVLKGYSHLERPNSAIQSNALKIAEKETAELLKAIINKAGFKAKEAVAAIPSFSCFTAFLEVPQMSDVDMAKTMPFQINQNIPVPVSEAAIEWLKLGERQTEEGIKQQILIILIPKEIIGKYKTIFKLAGLKLLSVESESLSLVRALIDGDPTSTLIIDIGSHSTNIAISDEGVLRANRFTDFAGASLTQAIAGGLNINVRRAEELKIRKGLKAVGGEYELSTLPQPFLDVIINEAAKAKEEYEKKFSRRIERIILAGGGANLIGINEYVEKQINLPIITANAFLKVSYPKELELLVKELGPEFSVAIGLGIKNN